MGDIDSSKATGFDNIPPKLLKSASHCVRSPQPFACIFGCHHVSTKLIEACKSALDRGKNVGILLLDLSKALDCLPHRLLLCKLRAYGMSPKACNPMLSYVQNRLQRVKIASFKSDWSFMTTRVPQDSIFFQTIYILF